jgi:penicillin-binding protein 1A
MIAPVEIANRKPGGLWWKIPVALVIWAALIAPPIAGYVLVKTIRGYARDLPAVPSLERWRERLPQSSRIVAADGSTLADLPFTDAEVIGHRTWVGYAELPELLIRAILAAEDVRFFEHPGVDVQAVLRAALANYRAGEVVEGASTITQQLARNLLPDEIGDERTVRRKVREAIIAYRIEQAHTKAEILEVYANLIFLGAQSYGVAAAAERYFGKRLDELELAEAAMIAGLAQAPGRADPTVDPAAARARRDEVLDRMLDAGFVDAARHRAAIAAPIALSPPPRRYGTLAPWLTERARRELEARSPELYRRGGWVAETAALPALAIAAEAASRERALSLASGDDVPEVAALAFDLDTGYLELLVGGRDFDTSQFNRAAQACRQPGSAFKPIVYGAALEADAITPGTPLRDGPIAEWDERLGVHWKPHNEGRTFRGVALAHDALASSLNAPAVDVLDRVGADRVIELARRLGITTEVDEVRPLALGSSCVIPLELARAFAVIARDGQPVDPIVTVRLRRGGGEMFDRGHPFDPQLSPHRRLDRLAARAADRGADPLMDPASAHLLARMLRDVVRRGTGTAARSLGRPAAGKTGTTNDNTDAWFVGFTARLAAAVWLGHDNPATHLPRGADGGRGALPLWLRLVGLAEGDRPARPAIGDPPVDLAGARVDRETGLRAAPGAGGAVDLLFKPGTEPASTASSRPDLPVDLGRTTREF